MKIKESKEYKVYYYSGWDRPELIDYFSSLDKAIVMALKFAKPYLSKLKDLDPQASLYINGPDLDSKYAVSYTIFDHNKIEDDLYKYIKSKEYMYYTVYLNGDVVKSPFNNLMNEKVESERKDKGVFMKTINLKEGQKLIDKDGNEYLIEKGDILQEAKDYMTIRDFIDLKHIPKNTPFTVEKSVWFGPHRHILHKTEIYSVVKISQNEVVIRDSGGNELYISIGIKPIRELATGKELNSVIIEFE